MKDLKSALLEYCMGDVDILEHMSRKYEVKVNMRGESCLDEYQILLIKEASVFEDTKKILFAESNLSWGYSPEVSLALFNKQLESAREFANELNTSSCC